jgi:2'-hydroxyisoflavone reductase
MMDILVFGGTKFLGRTIVELARAKGHRLTLFNRGQTNPDLFPDVEQIRGDRLVDLSALKGRAWDAVIDTSAYIPRAVRMATDVLKDSIGHYTLISTISVYSDVTIRHMDESGPVGTLEDENIEEVSGPSYGPLKVLCERALEAAMPGRNFVVRAGLIVGPHDPTDRFTYWPVRVAIGGEVLAPGQPDYDVQFIDVRDLSDWIIRMAEASKTGIYNATGPTQRTTMGDVLDTCKAVSGSDATFTWVSDEFLLENDVTPFTEMPLWVPASYGGIHTLDIRKALADGLTTRPLAETVRDTLRWNATRSGEETTNRRAGMMLDREADLLKAWKQRNP